MADTFSQAAGTQPSAYGKCRERVFFDSNWTDFAGIEENRSVLPALPDEPG
jgi:hypothetical protein